MITVTVQNHNHFTTLTFPCSENEMEKKLEELDRWDETNVTLFVDKVAEPVELSVLQDRFIDLDEVNYLAKRMDSFDTQEIKQFFAAIHHCKFSQVKDLINLTFNLPRYTLIQDLSSMEAVGQVHRFTLSGGMGIKEMESTDFAGIGRELLESGRGKVSEYGILFVNEEIPFDEVYDGQVFPEYYYEACLCTAMMNYREKTEYAYAEGAPGEETYHCLLVTGEDSEDGVLVESEGAGYARYASCQPGIRSFLREQLHMAADDILRGEMGKQADGSWLIGWDDIKEHLDITVSRINGIGQLLVEELNRREEVAEAIATEDGMEMSMILTRNKHAGVLDLFSVMGCNLTDVCLCHAKTEQYNELIARLNRDTLTAEGRKEWWDILSADVCGITASGGYMVITVTGCNPSRLAEFSGMVTGHCSAEHNDQWVKDKSRHYLEEGEQGLDVVGMPKKIYLIATYEELCNIPQEQRNTHYYGDCGEHFFNRGVTEEDVSAAYHKALDVIEMDDIEFQEPGNGFMYRGEVIARMRDCLLQKELKQGEQVLFVATQPYGGPGDFAFRGGIVESVDTWKKTCSVRSDFFTMDDVPLHYVLGRYNSDIREKHYGKECVEPLFGEHEALAQQYLREVEEDWNERWEESESQSDGMGMNL